ncbi:MAG: ATP-binding protein, partial [Proteobacteria bacterium]|nr:ATP-binding protein [Pseudomonadota bacterium]
MKFCDRTEELERLDRLARSERSECAFVWGRRRIGKTRLLLEWCKKNDGLYTVTDQSAPAVQRRYLAGAISTVFEGFSDVEYPDWVSLLNALARAAKSEGWTGPFVIDELPYIVLSDKTFPSVLQRWLDHEAKEARLVTAFAGSAQHMMHGLALDESSPLYGRAGETFRLGPLPAGHIQVVSGSKAPSSSLRHYATFGGIPRYWELAEPFKGDLDAAIDALVLDPMGPLHMEPDRLLAMEIPQATTLRPLLDVIGAGAHRVSEIGGRIGIPATSLSRPLTRLAELGFIEKEKPFGDPERGSKRTLYKLADPF